MKRKNTFKLAAISPADMLENETAPPEKFWVCDAESRNWTDFVMMGLTDGTNYWPFDSMKKFFDHITTDSADKTIYAHFGGKYDFLFCIEHVLLETNYEITSMIPRGSGLLCFDVTIEEGCTGNRRKDKEAIANGTAKRQTLRFRDSSAMLPFGLKSLTTNFKVECIKGEWDHSTTTTMTPELIKYNKDDCMGLHQVISKYFAWPIIKKAGSAFTIAGQAIKVLQTMMSDKIVYKPSQAVDDFVRRSYFGGRTEIFRPLYDGPKDSLSTFDVNSLYPFIMKDLEYPTRFKGYTSKYQPEKMGFYEAEVYVPEDLYCPPLGVVWEINKKKKFIFPTGRFKGSWSTMELEYARTLGVKIIKTGLGVIFDNGGYLFKEYVDTLYKIRLQSENGSVDNTLAKLLLNSCYGRFALRLERDSIVLDTGQSGVKKYATIGSSEKAVQFATETKILDSFTNVAVSAWVTSGARVHMHRNGYMKCLDGLYYTDTDSLFTPIEFENSKDLGRFKKENSWTSACFLLPKTYIAEGSEKKKVVMKGFESKKTKHFTVSDFTTALEGELKILKVQTDQKMATFKLALKKSKVLTLLPRSEREIRSMYDKRIIFKEANGSYNTRAHHIKNNEPIVFKP